MKAIRSDSEISAIAESCEIAALVLQYLVDSTSEGITTYDIDQLGKEKIAEYGAKSACYNYRHGANIFPAYTCISVNEEIVHGIGRIDRTVQNGDIISLDVCVNYNGYIGDNARTIAIGSVDPKLKIYSKTHRMPYSKESSEYGQAIESVIFQMLSNHLSSPKVTESFEILLDTGLVKPCMNCLKFQISQKRHRAFIETRYGFSYRADDKLGFAKYTIFRRWMDSRNG